MDELVVGILGALIAAMVSYLGRLAVDRIYRDRTKEISATFSSGKSETITVSSHASDLEISSAVDSLMKYEKEIYEQLQSTLSNLGAVRAHEGKDVDFIFEALGNKYAVEVKNSLSRVTQEQLLRYLSSEGGVRKAFVISRSPISKKTLDISADLVASGKVEFVEIPEPNQAKEQFSKIINNLATSGA